MSDINVLIAAVDRGMDIMDGYEREIQDLRANVTFEIYSLISSVEREKNMAEQAIEDLCYSSYEYADDIGSDSNNEAVYRKNAQFEALLYQTTIRGEELEGKWSDLCSRSIELVSDSRRIMGEYIRKLNLINAASFSGVMRGNGDESQYYVVILDSKKYPQTAEHIKTAQEMGFPEFVTLGRSEAAERRKASLANVKTSQIYDRDEWPMAVFEEGGEGADVAYVDGHDNRGAGSAISWQMRGIPDGSRVRVRVI